MSVNLILIPIMNGLNFFNEQRTLYPMERVSFFEVGDSQELSKNIEALHPKPLPEGKKIVLYERGKEKIDSGPYGDRITYLFPRDFRKMRLPKGHHQWDKAVLSFVSQLPEDTPILLFWR